MKKVVLYPFFSQQSKVTGQFLLNSCGSTKMNLFLAERIAAEFDTEVCMVLPQSDDISENLMNVSAGLENLLDQSRVYFYSMHIPSNNLWQRLGWYPEIWERLFMGCDLVINHHEVLGWPLKNLYPKMKIIQMNVIRPEEPWPWMAPLFYETWKSVDLIVALGVPMLQEIARTAEAHGFNVKDLSHWPLSFDLEILQRHGPAFRTPIEKDIDLLFVLRGSSTNYSHHDEFLKALILLRAVGFTGRVAFTDITHYMMQNTRLPSMENVEVLPNPKSQEDYVKMLWRSRAVIALNDNLHGGMSFREAIYCGACPIASQTPGYVDLLGVDWPYYVDSVTPERITAAVMTASQQQYWQGVSPVQSKRVHAKVIHESFQMAWERVIKADVATFLGDPK